MFDLVVFDGEPRVHDLRLAELLEFERPRSIRQIIERNSTELERYGPLPRHVAMVEIGSGAKRETTEYYLNEAQALLICMRSDAARAPDAREEIIKGFQAYRHGKLAPRPATLEEISELLQPIREHLVRHDGNIAYLIQITGETRDRVDDLVPRKFFSEENKRRFKHIVSTRYDGECPCCRKVKIIDSAGEYGQFDHGRGRELNGAYDGWYVCRSCNQRRKDHVFKAETQKRFDVFVDDLKDVFAGHSVKEAKKLAAPPGQTSFGF